MPSPKQSSKLFEMLSDLAKNPHKAEQFNQNPHEVLEEYEIEEDMKTLLIAGNWEDFNEAVRRETELYGLKAP